MKIFLFVDGVSTGIQTRVACKLDKEMFFMVDAVHKGDMSWLTRNFSDIPHRFYTYLGNSGDEEEHEWSSWCRHQHADEFLFFPTFLVCFDVGDEVSEEQWMKLDYYFLKHLGIVDGDVDEVDWSDVQPLLDQCSKRLLRGADLCSYDSRFMDENQPRVANCYEFDYEINAVWNICLAQIDKPNVYPPYTIVLRNFQENGFKRLFTGLFICTSWGSPADIEFLGQVWENLGMEGEFDLDNMLKEHTESCHPNSVGAPECEPDVYRLNIADTITQLKRKRQCDVIMEE